MYCVLGIQEEMYGRPGKLSKTVHLVHWSKNNKARHKYDTCGNCENKTSVKFEIS